MHLGVDVTFPDFSLFQAVFLVLPLQPQGLPNSRLPLVSGLRRVLRSFPWQAAQKLLTLMLGAPGTAQGPLYVHCQPTLLLTHTVDE